MLPLALAHSLAPSLLWPVSLIDLQRVAYKGPRASLRHSICYKHSLLRRAVYRGPVVRQPRVWLI